MRHRLLRPIVVAVLMCAGAGILLASAYNTNPPVVMEPGDAPVVWNAETPTPGTNAAAASQQVLLYRADSIQTPFAVDGQFSGAPGAFEVDVQVANVDVDANYVTIANPSGVITSVDAVNNDFNFQCAQCVAQYVRLLMKSRTNAVSITARIKQ